MTPERDGSSSREPTGGVGSTGPDVLAVVGPTATGKSELAVRVAEALDGEIVSMDSRQAYRGMEVGTAAPTPEQRRRVPHHGVGFLDPSERYGAGRFSGRARGWIREIRARGRVPILCGGTGLFLRALTDPVFREPEMADDRREALEGWLDGLPGDELRRWARRLDPELAGELDALDPQRAKRTLELALLAGRPLSWWHEHGPPVAQPVDALVAVLELDRAAHRRRIRARVERQLEEGWKEEVRRLREAGHGEGDPPFTALGYAEVAALLRGEMEREEVVDRVVGDSWSYARRQRTWFRHQVPEDALRLDAGRPTDELVRDVTEAWRAAATTGRPATETPGAVQESRCPEGEGGEA